MTGTFGARRAGGRTPCAGQPNRAAAIGVRLIVALGLMVGAWQLLQRRERV